ncbi:sensor histidine kinase, partial [Streptomyces sp. NPDC006356]
MWKTTVRAGRATVQLAQSMAMTFGLCLFICVLQIAVLGTLLVIGVWLLPETVLLIRRIAGAKRQMIA